MAGNQPIPGTACRWCGSHEPWRGGGPDTPLALARLRAHVEGMKEFDTIIPAMKRLAKPSRQVDLEDDVALLTPRRGQIATVDALVEGVHFLPGDPLETVARKLVHVNVSDILCKGALPSEALLTLGWPRERDQVDLETFARGLGEALSEWEISLIGGDTVHNPAGLFLSMTLIGACIGEGPVRRGGGKAGDHLWVTGEIGAGYLGLRAARSGDGDCQHLSHYHVPRLPPIGTATVLASHARAAMDVSDGLLGDGAALAEASGCGLVLDLDAVPFAEPTTTRSERLAMATGGDDYQCLFAADPARSDLVEADGRTRGLRLTKIGELTESPGLELRDGGRSVPLPEVLSYQHGA